MKTPSTPFVLVAFFLLAGFLIQGCAPYNVQLDRGAERIRIVNQEPQGMFYLGEVIGTGNQGAGDGTTMRLYADVLEQNAIYEMKNKANALGGTVVHLLVVRQAAADMLAPVIYVGAVYK